MSTELSRFLLLVVVLLVESTVQLGPGEEMVGCSAKTGEEG